MSFVFYDTETTGLNRSFDQILQFGAIQTDDDLNEIGRFDIRCRLLPHIVPSPKALCITNVAIEQLIDPSLPSHYEMMVKINSQLEVWSPSIFIGWNSIKFDEELLRNSFYQTLHRPYVTNTNGNCRCDALRIVQSSVLFDNNVIKTPTNYKNQPIFKLDQLAPVNGFSQHNAHEALGDVEATIHMCRLIKNSMPDHWSNSIRFAQKAAVKSFITEELVFSFTDIYYGKSYSFLMTTLGENPDYGSQFYIFDLANDPKDFEGLSETELVNRIQSSPKPIKILKTNSAPIITYEDEAPTIIKDRLPSSQVLAKRADYLKNKSDLREKLISVAHGQRTVYEQSSHVEEQLYNGFIDDTDWEIADKLHKEDWLECNDILQLFSDERLRDLGRRLIHQENPNALKPDDRASMDKFIANRLLGDNGIDVPWRTISEALEELDEINTDTYELDISQLDSIREFLYDKKDQAVTILN